MSNNCFCLHDYDVYGFDLDGCLLKYKLDPFFEYVHSYIVDTLVRIKSYDQKLFKSYNCTWKDVMFRGIIVDTKRGNLLKVMENGLIKRAYHGSRRMSQTEISTDYPDAALPVLTDILQGFNHKDEFHLVDNQFEAPMLVLYCELTDAFESKVLERGSFQQFWNDVYSSYVQFFHDKESPGCFYSVPRHAEELCVPASPALHKWFKTLKANHKTVFLMTSSFKDFAEPILKFLFGSDVMEYFDFFIGHAGKPRFFYRDQAFVDMKNLEKPVEVLEHGQWYEEGNYHSLTKLLKDFTGKSNPKVVYFGDGLKNDIFPSSRFGGWGTVLVLECMEAFLDTSDRDDCGTTKSLQIVDPAEQKYVSSNPVWGSFFEEDGQQTLFGRVIEMYAKLAVPWLDYITDLPLDYKFSTFGDSPSQEGYYPGLVPKLKR